MIDPHLLECCRYSPCPTIYAKHKHHRHIEFYHFGLLRDEFGLIGVQILSWYLERLWWALPIWELLLFEPIPVESEIREVKFQRCFGCTGLPKTVLLPSSQFSLRNLWFFHLISCLQHLFEHFWEPALNGLVFGVCRFACRYHRWMLCFLLIRLFG